MDKTLVTAIIAASNSGEPEQFLQPFEFHAHQQNELVFFFKPGCFNAAEHHHVQDIVELGVQELQRYRADVSGALLLSGSRLEELEIMDRHYGYINRLSKQASTLLHDHDIQQIYACLGLDTDHRPHRILGGHEFLREFPDYDVARLQTLWESKHSQKIRSGLYVQTYNIDDEPIILVNGFHPKQLAFFTAPDHKIVLLLLHSDTDWHTLKYDMVGETFPEQAKPGSIRGELYAHHTRYGLKEVTVANNMVHLSAGPFEAMFEVYNFLHANPGLHFDLPHTTMGRLMLARGLTNGDIDACLRNPAATIDGDDVDLFTLTEDTNSAEAIDLYIRHFR